MLTFHILFDEVDRGPELGKKFFRYHLNVINILLFLKTVTENFN